MRCTLRRNWSRKRSILADGDEIPTLCKTKNQQISRESHLPRALNSKKRCKPEDTEEEAFFSKSLQFARRADNKVTKIEGLFLLTNVKANSKYKMSHKILSLPKNQPTCP